MSRIFIDFFVQWLQGLEVMFGRTVKQERMEQLILMVFKLEFARMMRIMGMAQWMMMG